ncbi:MAG: efflux RND transporter periplasmic adaptor subunit [Deltaproteobacteria bacterium]|nr:efflux RND transporter periplasmic adaptor subunit [Deltaproteobacteria bacterium]
MPDRFVYVVMGVVLLAAIGFFGCKETGAEPKEEAPKPIPVQVETVKERELTEFRELSGDVHPFEVLPLSFKVGGRVSRILVEEGDEVKKGQLIALLDPRDYRLTRDLAESQVSALEPHLARAEKLLHQEVLPEAQLDELKSKMEAARIQRSQAQAQLSYARLNTTISGVVIKKMVAVGDLVGPSRPVAVIATMRKVEVILPVSQRDLPLFKEGFVIELDAPGFEKKFVGNVHRIGFTADEKTRTFPIVLEVDNPDLELRAGMVVEARIPVKRHQGIFVPLDTTTRDSRGEPMVFVVSKTGSRAETRPIRIGSLIGDQTQVLEGLAAGDQVIIRGLVQAGNPVLVVETAAKNKEQPQ